MLGPRVAHIVLVIASALPTLGNSNCAVVALWKHAQNGLKHESSFNTTVKHGSSLHATRGCSGH